MTMLVRTVLPGDYGGWRPLWDGYLAFYEASLDEMQTALTWERLLDGGFNLHGLVAERGGRLLGFAHYLFHPSSWADRGYAYLEDLYVDPAARGGGAGRRLIEAACDAARAQGAGKLYWLTKETNYAGRMLYDRVAQRTGFIHYAIGLSSDRP
jgi:GNAT superfamily N-acetyltransferase